MHIKNKDLTAVLNCFVRVIRQHRQDLDGIPPMAVVLTSDGKIAQFSGNSGRLNISPVEALRYLERGVYTLVREGRCRAIGIPLGLAEIRTASRRTAPILLEHQDGTAYRIELPCPHNESTNLSFDNPVALPAEARFFFRDRLH